MLVSLLGLHNSVSPLVNQLLVFLPWYLAMFLALTQCLAHLCVGMDKSTPRVGRNGFSTTQVIEIVSSGSSWARSETDSNALEAMIAVFGRCLDEWLTLSTDTRWNTHALSNWQPQLTGIPPLANAARSQLSTSRLQK